MGIALFPAATVIAQQSSDSTPPAARVGVPVRQQFDAVRSGWRWMCRVEEPGLLKERLRQALWVILAATALFTLADLGIPDDVFAIAYGLKLVHVALLVGMLLWLRPVRSARQILWAAIL